MRIFIWRNRKGSLKGNFRDKIWSQKTYGKCLRNCAESNFGKNKGPVLVARKKIRKSIENM